MQSQKYGGEVAAIDPGVFPFVSDQPLVITTCAVLDDDV